MKARTWPAGSIGILRRGKAPHLEMNGRAVAAVLAGTPDLQPLATTKAKRGRSPVGRQARDDGDGSAPR